MRPPINWYVGREKYVQFFARAFELRGTDWRMLTLAANGQPAVAAYVGAGADYEMQAFSVSRSGIARHVVMSSRQTFRPSTFRPDCPPSEQRPPDHRTCWASPVLTTRQVKVNRAVRLSPCRPSSSGRWQRIGRMAHCDLVASYGWRTDVGWVFALETLGGDAFHRSSVLAV